MGYSHSAQIEVWGTVTNLWLVFYHLTWWGFLHILLDLEYGGFGSDVGPALNGQLCLVTNGTDLVVGIRMT